MFQRRSPSMAFPHCSQLHDIRGISLATEPHWQIAIGSIFSSSMPGIRDLGEDPIRLGRKASSRCETGCESRHCKPARPERSTVSPLPMLWLSCPGKGKEMAFAKRIVARKHVVPTVEADDTETFLDSGYLV